MRLKVSVYNPGSPAEETTTGTSSDTAISTAFFDDGSRSGILTAKGFDVCFRIWAMFVMSSSGSSVAEAMVPSAPAFDTAAAISHPVIQAIPPWRIGCRMPNSSVILVLSMATPLS